MKDNEYIEKSAANVEDNSSREKKTPSSGKAKTGAFNQILNGEFLTKDFVLDNLNYIFFIFLLLVIIIAKSYHVKQVADQTNQIQIKLDQNTADYIDAKLQIENLTQRPILVEQLKAKELKESQKSIRVIRLKKNK